MPASRIETSPTAEIDDAAALSRVYTPGVADACREIAADPAAARRLTARGNCVAVVSDGSAVLGPGDVGPLAALLLDGGARELSLAAQRAAAQAIADAVTDDVRDPGHIVPDVFDEGLVPAVARAVTDA